MLQLFGILFNIPHDKVQATLIPSCVTAIKETLVIDSMLALDCDTVNVPY
jgi:hypothetical protein